MSDAFGTSSLADQILSASAEIWKRLRTALKVGTREEAVKLVGKDEQAALMAVAILMPAGAEQGSVLTGAANRIPPSVLTAGTAIPKTTKRKQRMTF